MVDWNWSFCFFYINTYTNKRTKATNRLKLDLSQPALLLPHSFLISVNDVLIVLNFPGKLDYDLLDGLNENPIVFTIGDNDADYYSGVRNRDDGIFATCKPEFPNQLMGQMCFPFLFRAA